MGDFSLGGEYPYLGRPSRARQGFSGRDVSLGLALPQVSGKSKGRGRIQSDFLRFLQILDQLIR